MKLGFPLFPESASTLAPHLDAVYFFGLLVSAVFSLGIALTVFYLATRYRRTPENQVGQREHAGLWLEITWSVIPLGIMLLMFVWGVQVFFEAQRPPADAAEYYVTGKQWMWKFQHPEGQREINTLHVPVGRPIKLTMTSEDVIHSFFVPAFRGKMDVLPGRYTHYWFEATKVGTYRLFCAEYCGGEHSLMGGSIIVMEERDYEAWLAGNRGDAPAAAPTGAELFAAKTCTTCHRPDSNLQGPYLQGIFGKEVELADGSVVTVDENYIRESILDPTAKVVKGYQPLMPTFSGQLSEEELLQLIIYIKSLSADEGAGAVEATTTEATSSEAAS
jgi:cytochrome c oxidase subunit 2